MRNNFSTTTSKCQTQIRISSPRVTLISSAANHPKREVHAQSTTSIPPTSTSTVPQENTPRRVNIVKSKEQIQETVPRTLQGYR